uniref:Hsp90 co-chaperone Cdc37 n=1 Tax=Clastoptera arizonana TaxID=38151 RepID=A0A1B6BYC6_9HEMI
MVDYSKWKNIEISDDEDETHPNIDTPSLFRWRHQARVERMEELKNEKESFERAKQNHAKKLLDVKQKLSVVEKSGSSTDVEELKKTLADLEIEGAQLKAKETELLKKDEVTPWNVDTISNPGFTKTVINKPKPRKEEDLTEEEREEKLRKFVKENEKLLKQFGMLRKYDDSKRFLSDNLQLVCDDTANYLVIWCINLEMEKKHDLMKHVAHQCICMQYLLELAKQLETDPRACLGAFFTKIQAADPEYKAAFDSELDSFKERISNRAKEKLAEGLAEIEEEERQARLGPGGLDPFEVLETLPEALKECFEKQDIPLLQKTIASLPQEEAVYYMKRCVDSGLWVPEGKSKSDEQDDGNENKVGNGTKEEPSAAKQDAK